MHDVSNAINILDPNKDAIDKAICKNGFKAGSSDTAAEEAGKCGGVKGSDASSFKQLSHMFEGTEASKRSYPADAASKMGNHTSATISKDTAALNREQKGVVSSAFAKAHEGAEIVEIRSISTTSVMVNACYDVLTDGSVNVITMLLGAKLVMRLSRKYRPTDGLLTCCGSCSHICGNT